MLYCPLPAEGSSDTANCPGGTDSLFTLQIYEYFFICASYSFVFFAYFPIKHYFTGSNSLSKANPEFACMFPRRFSMPNQLNDLPLNQRAR